MLHFGDISVMPRFWLKKGVDILISRGIRMQGVLSMKIPDLLCLL